jgi:hypothetical protein
MQIGRLARPMANALAAVLMMSATAGVAFAQGHDDHGPAMTSPGPLTAKQNELVRAVREATERFKNVTSPDGPGEGYGLVLGCVSGGDFGAMGLHYLNGALLGDGEINVKTPEIVLFEPTRDGGIHITGADYVVFAKDWDPKHTNPDGSIDTPKLDGQLFHLFDAPNRFGLPAFYTLHVWAWKDNPAGTFTNWNPAVSCDAFNPRTPSSIN